MKKEHQVHEDVFFLYFNSPLLFLPRTNVFQLTPLLLQFDTKRFPDPMRILQMKLRSGTKYSIVLCLVSVVAVKFALMVLY